MDFSEVDAKLAKANKLINAIAGEKVDAAYAEAADRDPLVAAEIAAMNARPMPEGGESR